MSGKTNKYFLMFSELMDVSMISQANIIYRLLKHREGPFNKFSRYLNMGSISFKKHETHIL